MGKTISKRNEETREKEVGERVNYEWEEERRRISEVMNEQER